MKFTKLTLFINKTRSVQQLCSTELHPRTIYHSDTFKYVSIWYSALSLNPIVEKDIFLHQFITIFLVIFLFL